MANPLNKTASGILLSGILLLPICATAEWTLSADGKAQCVLVRQAGASEPEKAAIRELAATLLQITGGEFKITNEPKEISERAIIVGPGPMAAEYFPEVA